MALHAVGLYVLLSILWTSGATRNPSSNEKGKRLLDNLHSHISRHDKVAVATWKGSGSPEILFLLREFPLAGSLWTLPTTSFYHYIKENVNAGVTTNVLALYLGQYAMMRLNICPTRPVDRHFVDCLLIDKWAAGGTTSNDTVSVFNTRTLSCDRSRVCSGKRSAIQCLRRQPVLALSASTRECHFYSAKQRSTLSQQSQLRNQVIYVGCVKWDDIKFSCQSGSTGSILESLRFYNVSLKWFFMANKAALAKALLSGDLDIAGNEMILNDVVVNYYGADQIIYEGNDIFYVKSANSVLTSFAHILVESKLALSLLLFALVCASLALTFADVREINPWRFRSVTDSFLFLLASVYATSLPIPRRRDSLLARSVVYSVWFLAILPFSNYFRSEFVSRLSVRSHGDVMDTLEELEDALSRKTIIPCLRIGTMIHHSVTRNLSYTNLNAKLSLAFYAAKERSSLETVNTGLCVSCAKREDHVCFTDKLSRCLQGESQGFVESRDTLNLVMGAMLVRKNFALKVAFRVFVRRIRETGLLWEAKSCVSGSANNGDSATPLRSDQLAELSRFLVLFAVFLAASTLVFVFELIMANL